MPPTIAAAIARRLCAADRAEEALRVIDAADRRGDRGEWPTFEWKDARIEVLDTLNRGDGQVKQGEQEVLHARDSVGQTSGATQRCLNLGFSERIGNSRRTSP